jgi:hypothetical protein
MANYKKQASPARRKRRVFEVIEPTMNDARSYVDGLAQAQVQAGLQRALEGRPNDLPDDAPSTLLGAQDAKYPGQSAEEGSRRSPGAAPFDLPR